MHEVKVDRLELLAKVEANREKHLKDYETAIKGFKVKWLEELAKADESARRADPQEITANLNLIKPTHHLDDYDEAIAMLQLGVEDQIVVTSKDIQHFVLDKWSWSKDFITLTSGYSECLN